MSKEIIIHEKQSSIFDIVEDTTTQMPIITTKDNFINLKRSSLLALKNNKELQHNLFIALKSDNLEELEFFFKALSKM